MGTNEARGSYKKMRSNYLGHKAFAHAIISAVAIAFLITEPFGAGAIEMVIFVVASQSAFFCGVGRNATFSGYGVALEINAICRNFNVPLRLNFGELCWSGCAVKPLIAEWKKTAGCALSLMLMVLLLSFAVELPGHTVPVALTYCAAQLLALLGEMYVWFAADRRVRWFLPEKTLRIVLGNFVMPKFIAELIIARARLENLLGR